MNYLGITTTELQANNDKPYVYETKPLVIDYLEQALSGRITPEILNSELPEHYLELLTKISKASTLKRGLLSFNISLANDQNGLFLLTKTQDAAAAQVQTPYPDPEVYKLIVQYFAIMPTVLSSYVEKVCNTVMKSQTVQVRNVIHNQNRYVQLAMATSPATFLISDLSDLDYYSYITNSSLESLLIIRPILPRLKFREVMQYIQLENTETISYNRSGGLLARPIVSRNGVRIRFALKDSANTRTIDLDFLKIDDTHSQ